jgi:heat shock protein HtpX
VNVRRTSRLAHLRTWLLVAGLTALLVGVGTLLGGAWLYLFVAAAIAMNVVGYWFSDRIALAASRARKLEPHEAPEVRALAEELAHRFQVPLPRLYLIPSGQPNAFATGRNPEHAAIAVTEGLLQQLPREQVRGVLAHEFAHIRNRDVLVATIAAVIAGAISAIANIVQLSYFFGHDDEDSGPLGILGTLVAIIVMPIAAMLLQLAVSRQREYLADATAARALGQGGELADALETLERETRATPMPVNPATASLYIADPLAAIKGHGFAGLFSTHPPIAERVRRLRAFDGAVETTMAAAALSALS